MALRQRTSLAYGSFPSILAAILLPFRPPGAFVLLTLATVSVLLPVWMVTSTNFWCVSNTFKDSPWEIRFWKHYFLISLCVCVCHWLILRLMFIYLIGAVFFRKLRCWSNTKLNILMYQLYKTATYFLGLLPVIVEKNLA